MSDKTTVPTNVPELPPGITMKDVARVLASIEYHKAYNARPDVQAKRREYNRARHTVTRLVRRMLKEKVGREGGGVE